MDDHALDGLHRYLMAMADLPFDPVQHNCARYVAGALLAMGLPDPREVMDLQFPGTAIETARLLARLGGVRGLAQAYFACESRPPLTARRGDVVIKEGLDGETLGIALGNGRARFLTDVGLQDFPMSDCLGCWSHA